ncbi:flagellar filament capping protein FliD [Telluria beijingensis]|uniref:flagellar filament capping protein FliD n=1 Tax=Telluria beijingensis TaxID=3068633 RepID=UPI002795633D|nr:flagellar filament capping protein FliD [Massilia sp. REN29]
MLTTYTTGLASQPAARQYGDIRTNLTQSLLAQNPGLKVIDAQVKRDDARLSSIGKMALALDGFRSVAAGLTGGKLDMLASASGSALTAKLSASSATPGKFSVDVQQLAQGQKLQTRPVADKDAALGSGGASTITVETGSGANAKKTTVRLDPGDNSLEGIAKAMREAGLDAEVTKQGDGYALSLEGETGAANGMKISVAGDQVLAGMFGYQPGKEGGMQEVAAAQDARVVVDGKSVTSATNALTDAIPGLTLTLKETGKSEVEVRSDPAAIASNVKDFVKAFNELNTQLGKLESGDSRSDTTLLRMKSQINGIVNSSALRDLAGFGITQKDGALVLDEDKLKASIAADPARANKVFSDKGGLAERLVAQVDKQIGSTGTLGVEAASVLRERDRMLDQRDKVIDTVSRQAALMAQQYQMAGTGGGLLFGGGLGRPMSLFDYMA